MKTFIILSSALCALILFCLLVSLPILSAGFYSDDLENSLIYTNTLISHQSIWQMTWYYLKVWMAYGRINFVSIYSSFIFFYLFPDVHIYQLVRVLFIWLSVAFFAIIIRKLTQERLPSLMVFLLFPLCWSIKNFHDPLTSFAILLPLTMILSSLSILFYMKWVEQKSKTWLVFSLLCYLLGLMTYEVAVVVLGTVAILAFLQCREKFFRLVFPYFLITLLFCLAMVLLHTQSAHVYDGVQLGGFKKSLHTFWAQFTSALPLSYRFIGKEPSINTIRLFQQTNIGFLLFFFSVSYFCFSLFYSRLKLKKEMRLCLFLVGVNFMVLPALTVAVSQKYQAMLKMGVGYLPVYVQYFGVVCVLLVLLDGVAHRAARQCLCVLFAAVMSFSFLLNGAVIKNLNHGSFLSIF